MEATTVKKNVLRRLYDQCMSYADTPKATKVFVGISFAESSFFPLPPDLLMVPMCIANKSRAYYLAFLGTVSSVIGGCLGYFIGYYLYNSVGVMIVEAYHLQGAMAKFQGDFAKYGFWLIALKGLTPIPYKLVTISSGVAHFDLLKFTVASIIARAFRFYLLATLLYYFGPMAKKYVDKYLTLIFISVIFITLLGFLMFKWLF